MRASHPRVTRIKILSTLLCLLFGSLLLRAQITTPQSSHPVSEADRLRGEYGPYRANNDLLYYHLDVRVDPDHQMLSGKNTIRFKMLEPGTRIQLDLVPVFNIDKVLLDERQHASPQVRARRRPHRVRRFSLRRRRATSSPSSSTTPAIPSRWAASAASCSAKTRWAVPSQTPHVKKKAPASGGRTKISGATKPDTMDISVEAPSDLVEVSDGRLQKKTDLGDGYTRWDWHVRYPINNYDVSLNVGTYVHFDDTYTDHTARSRSTTSSFPRTSTRRSTSSSRSRTCQSVRALLR